MAFGKANTNWSSHSIGLVREKQEADVNFLLAEVSLAIVLKRRLSEHNLICTVAVTHLWVYVYVSHTHKSLMAIS